MKTIGKITIGLATALLLLSGCGGSSTADSGATPAAKANANEKVAPTITEESLGLRKTDLYSEKSETTGMKTNYRTDYTGSGNKINRAFQDAPPMIPHDTTGLLPIKIGNNQCTGCHLPENAAAMNATPIPKSHFTNFRPTHNFDGKMFTKSIDNYKNEVAIKKTDHLQGARYNCSQCHAPQSQGDLAVENNFEATYTSADGASKSRWSGDAYLDNLNTIKGGDNFVTDADIANENSPAGVSPWTHH